MMPLLLAAVLVAGAAPDDPVVPAPPRRVRSVALAPGESCPRPAGDEVVVCAPLDEPYRIPKPLRRSEIAAKNQSWVNRVATMDEVGRVAGGLPDTCSAVGTGGQTGCTQSMMRAWAADRRQLARESAAVP
ncbi:hypothetical protein KZ813_17560 [Sphingomonas sp. RHCKR7]|uniref:hypothetical protein n=1 Tax=Sphingomonas folli TaxID=2862497 RepID=UPI001CA48BA8|nr:hypothetical protein [Sphingomonas folli]MBW6528652.1 hypothetical protein [Sphingomonas folli]